MWLIDDIIVFVNCFVFTYVIVVQQPPGVLRVWNVSLLQHSWLKSLNQLLKDTVDLQVVLFSKMVWKNMVENVAIRCDFNNLIVMLCYVFILFLKVYIYIYIVQTMWIHQNLTSDNFWQFQLLIW